jgi:hypothetical protein
MGIRLLMVVVCVGAISLATQPAAAVQIDLNDFFSSDPTVTVAADGSSALLSEDASLSHVLLTNDPFFGDAEVIVAGPGLLMFDFNFTEAPGEDDVFAAFVTGAAGMSLGPGFEFLASDSASGTVSFDLSGLVGEAFLGLQFQLGSGTDLLYNRRTGSGNPFRIRGITGDTGVDSTVSISNLRTEAPIPEPSALPLFLLGFGVVGTSLRRLKA